MLSGTAYAWPLCPLKDHVRERREESGRSHADIASVVGVTRQTIDAIERERYDPLLELAFELAEYFDCRVEELFDPDL